tara:strand:- start:327 stop:1118 length:792 start_codon:yes stop_codon:yes gene_type:complete
MSDKPVVIVTGGTYGLGRDISLTLARRGWSVVAFGLESRQASSLAENAIPHLMAEAESAGLSILAVEADVSKESEVARVISTTIERFGRIDALVNNAAIGPLGTVLDTSPELWDQIVDVNLKGPYLASRAVIPHFISQGGGSIVNVGSGSGWGKPNMAAYATTKGGLLAFSAATALDFFHKRIRVNTVIPGGGGIVAGMSLGRVDGDINRLKEKAVGTVAGRATTGKDLALAVAFLLSEDAEVISGTVLDVGCFAHQGSSVPL